MNLDELIQALQDLKESGKCINKLNVYFEGKNKFKSIDIVKAYTGNANNSKNNKIILK